MSDTERPLPGAAVSRRLECALAATRAAAMSTLRWFATADLTVSL
jgi:hypothetical protein